MKTQMVKPGIETAVRPLFEEEVRSTGFVEYGVSWRELLAGEVEIPPQGARFDIAFAGSLRGEGICGAFTGVDHMLVRADGLFQITIYATVTTDDGERIAMHETGLMLLDSPEKARLHLNIDFSTAAPAYDWLNHQQAWATGDLDLSRGEMTIRVFTHR